MPDEVVPAFPSGDGAQLAVALRAVEWELDNLAHDLPAGRAAPERLRDMATMLRHLAAHLDAVSGIVPGEVAGGTQQAKHERNDR